MYNTSLDPCFWYGCWQDSVEGEAGAKKDTLSGKTALTEQQKKQKTLWNGVRIGLLVLLLVLEAATDKKWLSLFECDLLVWVNSAVIVFLCKY